MPRNRHLIAKQGRYPLFDQGGQRFIEQLLSLELKYPESLLFLVKMEAVNS